MIERGNIGQELVENIGGLFIGIFTAKLDLQTPQFGGRAIRKKASDRRGRIRLPGAALFITGSMNTQMTKNCIDLAAPMVFDCRTRMGRLKSTEACLGIKRLACVR